MFTPPLNRAKQFISNVKLIIIITKLLHCIWCHVRTDASCGKDDLTAYRLTLQVVHRANRDTLSLYNSHARQGQAL